MPGPKNVPGRVKKQPRPADVTRNKRPQSLRIAPAAKGCVASGVLAEPLQGLCQDGGPVRVAAPLLHIGQVGLVRLAARRPGWVRLVATGRESAPGAVPGFRHGGITREARPRFMIVRAPEGDA